MQNEEITNVLVNTLKEVKFHHIIGETLARSSKTDECEKVAHDIVLVCLIRILSIYHQIKDPSGKVLYANILTKFLLRRKIYEAKGALLLSAQFEHDHSYIINVIIDTIKSLLLSLDCSNDSFIEKQAKWNFLSAACFLVNESELRSAVSFTIPSKPPSSLQIGQDQPTSILKWAFQCPFVDNDDKMRQYASKRFGSLFLLDECKMVRVMYGLEYSDFDHCNLVEQ